MTDFDHEGDYYPDPDSDEDRYSPRTARRIRGGKKALVALAGMAAIGLGVLFFVTEAMPAKNELAPQIGALSPAHSVRSTPAVAETTRAHHAATPTASSSTPVKSAVAPQRSPIPETSPSLTLAQRVAIARPAATGVAVPSALPAQVGITAVPPRDVSVIDTGSMRRDGATMRLVSALGDLTGRRELSWVADAGVSVGDGFCSQNFHYSAPVATGLNPSLMVCWRVSPLKSVISVAVTKTGTPSAQAGVEAIDRRWEQLSAAPMPSF
jgi:hypothetical protein